MNTFLFRDDFLTLEDGVILKSRIWLPQGKGPWPTLLMRQPYGKEIASTVTYAHPSWWASHGYLVVIQDVRGQGESTGEFKGFDQEASDTSATHSWVRSLPECNGYLGTYGFSYQGLTQLLAEKSTPPPNCLIPAMTGLNENEHWSCEGGAFWWHLGLGWGLQLAAQKSKRENNLKAWSEIRESLQSNSYLTSGQKLLEKHDPNGMASKWLQNSNTSSACWREHKPPITWLKQPMLLIGGWWDPHLKGILNLFEESKKQGGNPKLIIGPASHLEWWDGIQLTQLDFFNKHLQGLNTAKIEYESIKLWNITTKKWEFSKKMPSLPTWSLFSTGVACHEIEDGKLLNDSEGKGFTVIVHDPWRAVPSLGGHLSQNPGPIERGRLDKRGDIATFTSKPFENNIRVEGIPTLKIAAKSDQEGFDLCVALSIIPCNKITVEQLSTGFRRINGKEANSFQSTEIKLQGVLADLKKGDRIRISISGSSWPAIGVNPGTKLFKPESPSPHCVITSIYLNCEGSNLQFDPLFSS